MFGLRTLCLRLEMYQICMTWFFQGHMQRGPFQHFFLLRSNQFLAELFHQLRIDYNAVIYLFCIYASHDSALDIVLKPELRGKTPCLRSLIIYSFDKSISIIWSMINQAISKLYIDVNRILSSLLFVKVYLSVVL